MGRHRKLHLTNDPTTENNHNRPELTVWVDEEGADFDGEPTVTLMLGPLFGEQRRYVDMSRAEAWTLAALLKQVADEIDGEIENRNEAAYERQQERLMEDGPGPSLLEQQIAAMKFK